METHQGREMASPHDVLTTLLTVPADPDMDAYLASLDGPRFLFVGRLLPQERPDWLVAAYHVLATYVEPQAHLLLVATDGLDPFGSALDSYVAELHLKRAHVIDQVGIESLVACYRAADVFVTASEHDLSSAPLLEAMAFEVPVLARAFAPTADLVGDAGLLLGRDDGPLVAAEAMAVLARNGELRTALVDRGRRRLRQLDGDGARAALSGHLRSIVS
jgi:L-malate glycosyltransferase